MLSKVEESEFGIAQPSYKIWGLYSSAKQRINPWDWYYQTVQKPLDCLIFVSWAYILNFSFLGHVKVTFPPKLAIWLRKTKPSQPKKTKPPKPFKHPWINIFLWVEAAKFQLPRLCLSFISSQDMYGAEKPNQPY